MSNENHNSQPNPEADAQAERLAALQRVNEAMLEGGRAEIDAAQAELNRLTSPSATQPHESIVEVLPSAAAPRQRQFTGAPRRVALTGGRIPEHGGSHRHQKLYR